MRRQGAILRPGVVSCGLGRQNTSTATSATLVEVVPWGRLLALVLVLPVLAGVTVGPVARGGPDTPAAPA